MPDNPETTPNQGAATPTPGQTVAPSGSEPVASAPPAASQPTPIAPPSQPQTQLTPPSPVATQPQVPPAQPPQLSPTPVVQQEAQPVAIEEPPVPVEPEATGFFHEDTEAVGQANNPIDQEITWTASEYVEHEKL